MISLVSIPERIIIGQTLKIKLNIEGNINLKTYNGVYFNLILKKNGGTFGSTILYPLRFIGEPLEWEINLYSYTFSGTFNVNCIIQNGNKNQIANTTFIVEPNCIINKANCNNLSIIENNKKNKEYNYLIQKKEIPIDYTGGCSIQNKGTILIKEDIVKKNPISSLILTGKVKKNLKLL